MNYKVTIADIARELNTTPATVSRALSGHPGISEKTKLSVHQVAGRLNYKRNRVASSLRSGKTHVIGVIIPSAEINFFGSVVHGIESMANLNDYTVLIYQSNEARDYEVKGIETFLGARVDGILVSVAKDTTDHSHFLEIPRRGIPLVFFDRASEEPGIPCVVIDDHKGAYLATEHLIAQGYRRIAHIAGQQHLTIFADRLRGYTDALAAHGLPLRPELIYAGDVSIGSGRAAIRQFVGMAEPPDAVFAVEDFTALGAIKELKEQGIAVPGQFGVIGFANELFGEHISPGLSTIDQQTVLMGKESFRLLLELIEKKAAVSVTKGPAARKGRGRPAAAAVPEAAANAIGCGHRIVLEPVPVFRDSSMRKSSLV